jgi:WD40 repeat protein
MNRFPPSKERKDSNRFQGFEPFCRLFSTFRRKFYLYSLYIDSRVGKNCPSRVIMRKLDGHSSSVTALIILPNGFVVSGSLNGEIKIWDPNDGTLKNTL